MGGKILKTMVAISFATILGGTAGGAELTASYLYNLSDFTGIKPYNSARISVDESRNEIYAMSGESVNIFNGSGMEVFRFDYDPGLGIVYDVAVDGDGEIYLLALKDRQARIIRCNFRAEPIAAVDLKGMPPELASFSPDRMFLREGRLYLASMSEMQVVVVDTGGKFLENINIAAKIGFDEKERSDSGIGGLALDRDGNLLFTIPTQARVYRLGRDGDAKSFGKRGSGPGKFGVATGIAVDRNGNLLVSDTLRCVVMVFDKNFGFIREFGFRGFKPGNLIGPNELMVDGNNRVYVSQIRKRGVSVYQISSS